jgi:hypothetical protein
MHLRSQLVWIDVDEPLGCDCGIGSVACTATNLSLAGHVVEGSCNKNYTHILHCAAPLT